MSSPTLPDFASIPVVRLRIDGSVWRLQYLGWPSPRPADLPLVALPQPGASMPRAGLP